MNRRLSIKKFSGLLVGSVPGRFFTFEFQPVTVSLLLGGFILSPLFYFFSKGAWEIQQESREISSVRKAAV